jgi:histidinol-phosphate aminotransferase
MIVTRTFSKVYGMAGMRVGYALARPEVINRLNSNRGNSLSILSGYAASAAMDDHDYVRRSQELVHNGKDYFYKELDAMGVEYVPSESSFILINVRQDSDAFVEKMAREYNVEVGNARARWGIDNYIRVTAGLPEENEAFIAALKKVLVAS